MDHSKLNYQQILERANSLKASATKMQNNLDEVKRLFGVIGTDDAWNGTAAGVTKNEFNRLSEKFPDFSKAVDDCSIYLNSVVENYQSVDSIVTGN